MAKEIIHLQNLRLHCDACGYDSPPVELSREYIGRPCPHCGENPLTERDYESTVHLVALTKTLNDTLGPIFGAEPGDHDKHEGTPVSIGVHNDTVTINPARGHKS